MLSRTKREKHRRNKVRKRIFFGFVSLSMCFGLTMGVAYADVDVTQFLQGWYSQSAETAKQSVTDALKTETKVQKERLKAEIQRKLLESAEDLKQFTMEERSSRLKSLTDYSGHLIDNLDISNEKDKRQIERKLAAILSSAQNAMEDMADSYEAPSLEFVPAPSPHLPRGAERQYQRQKYRLYLYRTQVSHNHPFLYRTQVSRNRPYLYQIQASRNCLYLYRTQVSRNHPYLYQIQVSRNRLYRQRIRKRPCHQYQFQMGIQHQLLRSLRQTRHSNDQQIFQTQQIQNNHHSQHHEQSIK
nr:hypothetical protein [Brevibacillus laterosporus]